MIILEWHLFPIEYVLVFLFYMTYLPDYAESKMKNIYLNTSNLPREFSVCPKVFSIACHENHPLMPTQVVHGLQVCLRFHGSAERIDFAVNGRKYSAGFPHLLIKRDHELHQISTMGVTDSFYFTYSPDDAPVLPNTLTVCEFQYGKDIDKKIHEIIQLVNESCEYGVFDRIDGMCQQLLIDLLIKCSHGNDTNEDELKIRKIASYLQIHFNEDISFDGLAVHFGYSPRSFYRHWNKCHKKTPHQFIIDLKIEESKRLLCETDLSIEEIGEIMNYGSSAYFVSFFHKHTKSTPLQYRKKCNLH